MFPVEKNRKRSRRALSQTAQPPVQAAAVVKNGSLKGVVACLTGLAAEEKERLHASIQQMGGRFSRDLNSTQNTHLVAGSSTGEKYETALSFSHIQIVTPDWVDACIQKNARLPESDFRLLDTTKKPAAPCKKAPLQSLLDEMQSADMVQRRNSTLFGSCHFYLVGFEVDSNEHLQLGRWIRRGLGTIYWEITPSITHLIVNDNSEESIRDAAYMLRLQHPNCPIAVSPWWIVSSWKDDKLLPISDFAPQYQQAKKKVVDQPAKKTKEQVSRKAASLFRGSVFVLLRVAPPDGAVDFDSQELETTIRAHGGQMLSSKLLQALKVDRAAAPGEDNKRKCFVVCWGGGGVSVQQQVMIHPLLSQAKRHDLCHLVETTPVWLHTSCSEQKIAGVDRCPILFGPQPWSILSLGNKGDSKKDKSLRISVTGFSGSRRSGMTHLIEAMGATYDDSMRTSTTHLICRESTGQKYEKAVEWKLQVVSIEWLYHVARYGYTFGCESKFSLDANLDSSK